MSRPYFFWDYDISENEIRNILTNGTEFNQAWIISRLINRARWDDIWKFTSPAQIEKLFPHLSFWPKETRSMWRHALNRWLHAS